MDSACRTMSEPGPTGVEASLTGSTTRHEDSALRAAWRSLRLAGLVAPELPSVVFVALASWVGFGWSLGTAGVVFSAALAVRIRRSLPLRAVLGGGVGLAVTATIAGFTGVAASGLLTDIVTDLMFGALLAGSVAVRHPLFGVLWKRLRHQSHPTEPVVVHGYVVTTTIAAVVLLARGSALTAVYVAGEPVGWLLAVKVALGLPGTLLVVAAFYAAGGLERHAPRQRGRRGG